jgi:succinyl-diaminopimelate desuccinylase
LYSQKITQLLNYPITFYLSSEKTMNLDWDALLNDCVDFTQRLIQTPSMTYEEAPLAELVAAELQRLNFDQVWIDEIGNVNGRIRGTDPSLGALVLNTHLDHVDPGERSLWSVPPYSGTIVGDRIVGRGACDIKGPLAVQVYSLAALLRAGVRPRRDVVFSGVVEEEIGGTGAKHWVKHLDYPVDLVVLGEPSDNKIALGHRGIAQMWVQFNGRSVHASVPEKGVNPNFALAQFIQDVQAAKGELSAHELLGATSVTPTIIEVDTTSTNVTPSLGARLPGFPHRQREPQQSARLLCSAWLGDQPILLEDAMCTPPKLAFPDR